MAKADSELAKERRAERSRGGEVEVKDDRILVDRWRMTCVEVLHGGAMVRGSSRGGQDGCGRSRKMKASRTGLKAEQTRVKARKAESSAVEQGVKLKRTTGARRSLAGEAVEGGISRRSSGEAAALARAPVDSRPAARKSGSKVTREEE